MAWDIFKTAFADVFNRFGLAVKITLVPFFILMAMSAILIGVGWSNFSFSNNAGPQFSLLVFFIGFLIIVASIILFAWAAISWHRATLLNETVGFIPSLSGLPVGRYIGYSILIVLILVVASFVVVMLIGLVSAPFLPGLSGSNFMFISVVTLLIGSIAGIVLQYFWLRLAVILPGIAVDRPLGIGDGWHETREYAGPIFWLAAIITAITTGFSLLLLPIQMASPTFSFILQIPFNFIFFIFGISVMTEVYKRTAHVETVGDVFD